MVRFDKRWNEKVSYFQGSMHMLLTMSSSIEFHLMNKFGSQLAAQLSKDEQRIDENSRAYFHKLALRMERFLIFLKNKRKKSSKDMVKYRFCLDFYSHKFDNVFINWSI